MNLVEALEALNKIYLDESAKTDFIAKFGQDTFNNFEKAKQRLVNKGLSVDYGQYLKKDKKEVDDLILSLYDKERDTQKKRILQGTDKDIRGEYRDLGIRDGYHVFEPLNVQSSMDLGVNTGWCTTGRYGHYGHPEFTPSYEDAEEHWEDYTSEGIRFFYLLDPKTMYGKYAIALYPSVVLTEDDYVTNVEIYNDKDDLDYTIADQIDLSKLTGEEIIYRDPEEFEIHNGVLVKYSGSDKHVNIPNNVTSIGERAFDGCTGLTSVIIPDSVTSISDNAFYCRESLTSIVIPDSVTSIGSGAFSGCSSLTSITIPDSVTSIEGATFSYCSGLKSINIPDSVTSIGNYAFEGCSSIESISIPNSVTTIGDLAFHDCKNLKNITIPDSVTKIGNWTLYGCSHDHLTIKTNNERVKQEFKYIYNIVSY